MNETQVIKILDTIEADIPKLKAFLVAAQNSPVLTAMATRFFPALGPILPEILKVVPYLDFLAQLAEQAETAIKSVSPPSGS